MKPILYVDVDGRPYLDDEPISQTQADAYRVLYPIPEIMRKITLNEKEALVLKVILHKVGGEPLGPRGAASCILKQLDDVDLHEDSSEGGTGGIQLVNTWGEFMAVVK